MVRKRAKGLAEIDRRFRVTKHALQRFQQRIGRSITKKELIQLASESIFCTGSLQALRARRNSLGKHWRNAPKPEYILRHETQGVVLVCAIDGVAEYTIVTVLNVKQVLPQKG